MRITKHTYNQQPGFILVSILATTFFIMLIGIATTQLVISNLQVAKNDQSRLNAQFSADAAIDHALQEINQDQAWTGTAGEQILYQDSKIKTTYESTVVDDADSFVKYINVVGRSYSPASATTPKNVRKYQVKLSGIGGGNYSIVTGVGGLTMLNSSRILDGNVYINGTLTMSNSSQIGLTTMPVNVKVAHQSCPNPANGTYPRVCASGENGEPISITNPAHIYGEVQATNQTNGSRMSNPGLVSGNPPAIALPNDHNRNEQIESVTSTITGSSAGCSFGLKTWAANTKITGNVTIKNLCLVKVEGNIWITGNLSLQNLGVLKVKEGLSTPPVIMIDGSSGLTMKNASILLPNLSFKGFRVITYYSSAACSPDCSNVTGVDLYNSKNLRTIYLVNSSSGPFSEFYSRWSKIEIANSGNVGALVGQEILMSNASAVTFGVSVSGVNAPNAWVIKSYKRQY